MWQAEYTEGSSFKRCDISSMSRCPAGDEYIRCALSMEARMLVASHAFALRHASIKMRRPKSRMSSCCSSATVRFDSNFRTSSIATQLQYEGNEQKKSKEKAKENRARKNNRKEAGAGVDRIHTFAAWVVDSMDE